VRCSCGWDNKFLHYDRCDNPVCVYARAKAHAEALAAAKAKDPQSFKMAV
jgi:hypothetical protein